MTDFQWVELSGALWISPGFIYSNHFSWACRQQTSSNTELNLSVARIRSGYTSSGRNSGGNCLARASSETRHRRAASSAWGPRAVRQQQRLQQFDALRHAAHGHSSEGLGLTWGFHVHLLTKLHQDDTHESGCGIQAKNCASDGTAAAGASRNLAGSGRRRI